MKKTSAELICGQVKCPMQPCTAKWSDAQINGFMTDETKAAFASALTTIPTTITPWPQALDDFNYEYSDEGKLRHKITSK
jgi:hypothetical protein